ncbi:dynamin family protein [uncultured Ruminococcus sp.]|uniref:dynamin family protein n=1 Tax=uncultured Ruminococcus sp. TaxID=165186 RepID=UPI002622F4AF|nr:dynamin family protein [uncultured Ruminococcus sp.]
MKELYTTYIQKFQAAKTLAEKYALSTEKLEYAIAEIPDFKVTVPFIGGFSTGKSSLLNTLMERELLSTEITPETAVPTEVSYGTDSVTYCTENGETYGKPEELNTKTLSAEHVHLVKLTLENAFLKQIPTLKLVDMPGFDSGCEVHNRAIDDYLPNSLAYLITVSADEGTIRESVLRFLDELKLNEKPVFMVITKSDKIMPDELEETVSHIRQTMEQKMGLQNVKIAITSSAMEEAEELKELLLELQSQSDQIFQRFYSQRLCVQLDNIRIYLKQQLSLRSSDAEQLQADKELLEEQIKSLQNSVEEEKSRFAEQANRCISAVQNRVGDDLRKSASVLENLLIQGGSIQDKVNYTVRNAITSEIHNQLEPKIRRYLNNISDLMQAGNFQTDTSAPLLQPGMIEDNERMRSSLQNIVTPVSSGIAVIVGSILGPIGAAVGFIVGTFIGNAINKHARKKEAAQKREAAAQRVREIIQEVTASVRPQIESSILEMTDKVNAEIDVAIAEKVELHRKALADLEEKLHQTEQERQAMEQELTADLQQVEMMLKQEGVQCNV